MISMVGLAVRTKVVHKPLAADGNSVEECRPSTTEFISVPHVFARPE